MSVLHICWRSSSLIKSLHFPKPTANHHGRVIANLKPAYFIKGIRNYGLYRDQSLTSLRHLEDQRHSRDTQIQDVTQRRTLHDASDFEHEFIAFEDQLFNRLRGDKERVPVNRFIAELKRCGLRKSDPRLTQCIERLRQHQQIAEETAGADMLLDREAFKLCINENVVLLKRAFLGDFVIPQFVKFTEHIGGLFHQCKTNCNGTVASYIPQLSRYSADYWGVSLCTIDGQRHSLGDTNVPFCLQSCSKPLAYALALDEMGSDAFHEFVGQEPSGITFNAIALDKNNKPHNPMINPGAIVTASLLKNSLRLADRFDYVSHQFKRMAGNEYLSFNNSVFLSERETADRNFALGYYLKENKCFPNGINLTETLDFYFQMCSVEVDCESASVIAATLANGGICPLTGEQVLGADAIRNTLSLMHSCGMYDYSGQFAFTVGLPAKSGVSGAVLLVVPNVMGICLWSPPLDECGNSERGLQFCKSLVNKFNFHQFDNLQYTRQKHDPRRSSMDRREFEVTSLLFGAYKGDISALERMHLSRMKMSRADYDGRTALHLSAAEGHAECVKFLLDVCRVPPEPKDRWDQTPLNDAERQGHEHIATYIREFIKHHDRVSDPNKYSTYNSFSNNSSNSSNKSPNQSGFYSHIDQSHDVAHTKEEVSEQIENETHIGEDIVHDDTLEDNIK